MSRELDIMRPVSLMFDKAGLPAGDKREPWHPCLFVTNSNHESSNAWCESAVAQQRSIGPCQLIRVADMLGFDSETRPGASSRTEQFLVFSWSLLSSLQLGVLGTLQWYLVAGLSLICCLLFFHVSVFPVLTALRERCPCPLGGDRILPTRDAIPGNLMWWSWWTSCRTGLFRFFSCASPS